MDIAAWALFLPACFALNMAPGPNNLLSISNATRYGFRASCLGGLGRVLAFAGMIALASVGLAMVLHTSEWLFGLIKLAGAGYLFYLAYQLWRAPVEATAEQTAVAPAATPWGLARQEFWVAAGNPKAILIFTAFFPQFIDRDQYMTSFALLGVIFLLLELVAIAIYAALGTRLRAITGNASRFRTLNRISGGLMIGFGVMLALASRPAS